MLSTQKQYTTDSFKMQQQLPEASQRLSLRFPIALKKKIGTNDPRQNKQTTETKSPHRKSHQKLYLNLKLRVAPTKVRAPFRCIYCNGNSFASVKLDLSRGFGLLDCQSCGAEFKHGITANLRCAGDVEAALLAGDKLKWMCAKQVPAHA